MQKIIPKLNQDGKIDRGSIFIVAILVMLIFTGYLFVGGTLPVELPGTNNNIVAVNQPDNKPAKNNLQLYTFSGATITPATPPSAAPAVSTLPINTIDTCSSTLQGSTEPYIIWAYRVAATQASGNQNAVEIFYDDEHALPLGSVAMKQSPTDHISHPTINTKNRDQNNFTLSPAAFVTDITANSGSTAGDAQSGGIPQPPSDVFGSWMPETNLIDPATRNQTNLGSGADAWPASNGPSDNGFFDIGGHEVEYTAEIVWRVTDLKNQTGQLVQTGHTYRIQVAIHDGDRIGDVSAVCFNVTL